MRKLILTVFVGAVSGMVNAIVINANTQNLYLGDNNVSCGRITLTNGSRQSDVESFCSVVSSSYQNGIAWLSIQTTELGVVDCAFSCGRLNECFKDN